MSKTLGQLQVRLAKTPQGAGVDGLLLRSYINAKIREIIERNDWLRLIKTGTLQTVAPYDTGTLAVTNGLNTLTLTGGTFIAGMTGRPIRIANRPESYIFTYLSASTGTLSRVYEGDTDTAAAFKMFKNVYAAPSDLDRIESIKVPRTGRDLDQCGREYLDERDAARTQYGAAEKYALYDDSSDATPLVQIELWPIPDRAEGLPIRYRVLVAELAATGDTLAGWINPFAVLYGVEADLLYLIKDYTGGDRKLAQFESALAGMLKQDAMQTDVERIEINSNYSAHRALRRNDSIDSDFEAFYYQTGE